MCHICDKVEAGIPPNLFNLTMEEIGAKIKSGVKPEHFKVALDTLLFTEIEDRDRDVEEAWEDDYRGTD